MTENTVTFKRLKRLNLLKQQVLRTVLLCSVLTLTACGGFNFPGFEEDSEKKKSNKLKDEITELRKNSSQSSGYSPKNLFGKNIRSTDERIARLERAVQDMRNEFDSAKPSIKRLTALESEIQILIRELEKLNNSDSMMVQQPMAQQPAPAFNNNQTYKAPKPVAQKTYQKKSPPPVQSGKASVYDVRVGEHPGRTRLVIDTNTSTPFNVDVDNNENIMIVDLPQTGWNASKTKSFARSNFISSYKVETSGQGHILILQLKKNARVTYKKDLKAVSGNSRRLVIDLSS